MQQRASFVTAVVAACVAVAVTAPSPQARQQTEGKAAPGATAELKDRQGQVIGRAQFAATPHGVLVTVRLERAPTGEHAFHVHETGKCDPPAFQSAGGHYNPGGKSHGFLDRNGPHAGDLPNIHVPASGQLTFETLVDGVTLDAGSTSLLDQDGSALVIHAKPDDYRSNPAGDAGDRVACGTIQKP